MRDPNMLDNFRFQHLPPHLQAVSEPFANLAITIYDELPDCDQRDVALQKLLEAKDAAVRTAVSGKKSNG